MRVRIWQVRWTAMGLVMVLASGCGSPNNGSTANAPRQAGLKMPTNSGQAPDPISREILPETHVAAGRLHESEGRLGQAAAQYRLAIAANPKNIEAYNRLGIVLDQLGKFREADEMLSRAVQLAPRDAYLRNNLAFSYIMQGRWADAQAELAKAIEMRPNFVRARVNMGTVLAQQGRFEDAFKNFYQVLRPEDAYYNIGLMYQSKQRTVEAAQAFQQALAANPRMTAAKKRLELLPPTAVAEAGQRGGMFTSAVALTGQTSQPPPAAPPPAPQPIDTIKTDKPPVPTTEPESVEVMIGDGPSTPMAKPQMTETPGRDVQPAPTTQPESIEILMPPDSLTPGDESDSFGVAAKEIEPSPATPTEDIDVAMSNDPSAPIAEAVPIDVAMSEDMPSPTTRPASIYAAISDREPMTTTEPESVDVAMPAKASVSVRNGILAALARPAALIGRSIEPIETIMGRILPAVTSQTTAVASPQPPVVVEPQAEGLIIEDVPATPSQSAQP